MAEARRTADEVWLAGLGALDLARERGAAFFQSLVERARQLLPSLREARTSYRGELSPEFLELTEILVQADHASRLRLETIIESMLPQTVPGSTSILQARRNAEARARMLGEFGVLTSAQVAEMARSRAKNKAALANRWKQEGRIFSVAFQGTACFPAFQFDYEGRPLEAVASVIRALSDQSSEWELALWFISANGWLGGRRPVDLLSTDPRAVAKAAEHEASGLVY